MTNNLVIQIIIPTYNRATWAQAQARSLLRLRKELQPCGIDLFILVSDNKSQISFEVPPAIAAFTEVVFPETHLPTAEENLIFAIGMSKGDYLWVLGDDDSLIFDNIFDLIKSLKHNQSDFIICNSAGALNDGTFIKSRTSCSRAEDIKDLPDFVTRTGFWFVIAGFSCLIFKRKPVVDNIAEFQSYFTKSKIYSHVFWLLDTFWEKSFLYYDRPVVVYKQNATDVSSDDHWDRLTSKENLFIKYFWTVGFVRHATQLRCKHDVPLGYFSSVVEQDWHGRYLHLPLMLSIFFEVLEGKFAHRPGNCRGMTTEEKKEVIEFLSYEDCHLSEILASALRSPDDLQVSHIQEAKIQLQKYTHEKFYNYFLIKNTSGWTIYKFDRKYRAIPFGHENFCWQELSDIAPVTSERQLIGDTLEEVEMLISKKPFPLYAPQSANYSYLITKDETLFIKRLIRIYYKLRFLIPVKLLKKFK